MTAQSAHSARLVALGALLGLIVLGGFMLDVAPHLRAQSQPTSLRYLPARGGQPDVLVILRDAPDLWQLCAQRPDSDQMDCRAVQEVRKWLRERPQFKR